MSDIRDKARERLDKELPPGKIITSNGPTGAKYTEMTGLTHERLTANWATGGILTGCNGFTGWFGRRLGSEKYLGVFDLQKAAKDAGKPNSWVKSTKDNRPNYGDILRHASFHVDVALDFDGDILNRAAGGQGGPKAGCDIIKRVKGKGAYNPADLVGWIDIDLYFGSGSPAIATPTPEWLIGWWEIVDGADIFFYYFFRSGVVQYTRLRPNPQTCPSLPASASGAFTMGPFSVFTIVWNNADYPNELFAPLTFDRPPKMAGSSPGYSGLPFTATKLE